MLIFILVWFFGWFLTWPALLAYCQGKYPQIAKKDYRKDLAFCTCLALIPVTWFMTPFMTQFYCYGFQIFPKR